MMTIKDLFIKPVKKGDATPLEKVELIAGFGPKDDAYGGPGDRQITLLGEDDKLALQADMDRGLCIKRFTPNIEISGSSSELIKGKRYSLGKAEITISPVSKKCHEGCLLREEDKRICLLPKTARFASIDVGAVVTRGEEIKEI